LACENAKPLKAMTKKAVLLVNLGSPDSPAVPDVRRYLREFLMDGRVLDAPWPIRFGVVNFTILPKRPHESAHAYQKIWTDDGSPLVVTSRHVQAALQKRLNIPVELAMRYQNPSIDSAVGKTRGAGHRRVVAHSAFSALRNVELRNRSRAREKARFRKSRRECVCTFSRPTTTCRTISTRWSRARSRICTISGCSTCTIRRRRSRSFTAATTISLQLSWIARAAHAQSGPDGLPLP
jgi:hypothetical protein